MKLIRIQIHSFRNIANADISPHERFNIIVGNNAQGKTNLLESVYLLGTMKSFRMTRNCDLISYGVPFSLLKGWVTRDNITREITLSIKDSGKKAFLDRKPVNRPSDFFGNLNMVVFSPEDIAMVRGLPETRRRYLDRAIFSGDTGYLDLHHEYFRILKNRNSQLKRGIRDGLRTWSSRLADAGSRLMARRESFVTEIAGLLREQYPGIAGPEQKAEIRYRSRIATMGFSPSQIRERLLDLLSGMEEEELRRGTTLAGPHRDDLEFVLNGKPLNHHGSQGEQRSFVLSLKMAEIEYLKRKWGNPPVLLLDDMTSELDRDRNRNFIAFLNEKEMQVFITTTSLDVISFADVGSHAIFPVKDGKVAQQ